MAGVLPICPITYDLPEKRLQNDSGTVDAVGCEQAVVLGENFLNLFAHFGLEQQKIVKNRNIGAFEGFHTNVVVTAAKFFE